MGKSQGGNSMKKVKSLFKSFMSDESGQGTAEYVLLIALVAGAFMIFKKPLLDWFSKNVTATTDKLDQAIQ